MRACVRVCVRACIRVSVVVVVVMVVVVVVAVYLHQRSAAEQHPHLSTHPQRALITPAQQSKGSNYFKERSCEKLKGSFP